MIVLFGGEINPLDKYWQASFYATKSPFFVAPATAAAHNHKRQFCEGLSRFPVQQYRWLWVPAFDGYTG